MPEIRHTKLGNRILVVAATAVALFFAEGVLRVHPEIVDMGFANGILSRYNTYPDGIYWRWPRDPSVVNLMKPNYRTTMYANGYRWTHQTDRRGFRNAVNRDQADVILLGDSMIYGHGVEIDETVGHYLESETGRIVVSLARQGDCIYDQLRMLASAGLVLQPRIAVHFFFENDISDLLYAHPRRHVEAFLKAIDHGKTFVHLPEYRPANMHPPTPPWSKRIFLLGAFRYWLGELEKIPDYTDEQLEDGWRLTERMMRHVIRITRDNGIRLVLAPITDDPRQFGRLKSFAVSNGVDFVDTRGVFSADWSRLPGDGHLSAPGAKALATLVGRRISAD